MTDCGVFFGTRWKGNPLGVAIEALTALSNGFPVLNFSYSKPCSLYCVYSRRQAMAAHISQKHVKTRFNHCIVYLLPFCCVPGLCNRVDKACVWLPSDELGSSCTQPIKTWLMGLIRERGNKCQIDWTELVFINGFALSTGQRLAPSWH